MVLDNSCREHRPSLKRPHNEDKGRVGLRVRIGGQGDSKFGGDGRGAAGADGFLPENHRSHLSGAGVIRCRGKQPRCRNKGQACGIGAGAGLYQRSTEKRVLRKPSLKAKPRSLHLGSVRLQMLWFAAAFCTSCPLGAGACLATHISSPLVS